MNKKDYYKLLGKLEAGGDIDIDEVYELANFTDTILNLIKESAEDAPDFYGTEGWEHAVGWD